MILILIEEFHNQSVVNFPYNSHNPVTSQWLWSNLISYVGYEDLTLNYQWMLHIAQNLTTTNTDYSNYTE